MKSCSNVHGYWSSHRVPNGQKEHHRVPVEFPFPFLVRELTGGESSILLMHQKPTNKKKDTMKIETQTRNKYNNVMIKKLQKKNQKYYVLDSEVIGLRIYVQITGDKSFYLQRYIKECRYSKKTKIGDFPEMSIAAARKLADLIKADKAQGKDPIVAATERVEEKTLDDVVQEYLIKKRCTSIQLSFMSY